MVFLLFQEEMIDAPVGFKYEEDEDDGNNNPVLRTTFPGEMILTKQPQHHKAKE
jgi:hypothetical protein